MEFPCALATLNKLVSGSGSPAPAKIVATFIHVCPGGGMYMHHICRNDNIEDIQRTFNNFLEDYDSIDRVHAITYDLLSDSICWHNISKQNLSAIIKKLHAIETHEAVRISVEKNAFEVIGDIIGETSTTYTVVVKEETHEQII